MPHHTARPHEGTADGHDMLMVCVPQDLEAH